MNIFTEEADRAQRAQEKWARLPVRERLQPIRELRFLLVDRLGTLSNAIRADIRRETDDVVATDILPSASALKFLEQSAERLLRPQRVGQRPLWLLGSRETLHRSPHGVVGLIGTWNYPTFLNIVPIGQAVTAGNAVLWKPSELVPRTSEIFAEMFHQCGFPKDLIVKLPTDREAGPQLLESEIDFLHFTGSDGVGRRIAARLGERLIPSTLELSGCDAFVVLDDADIEFAARAAWFGATLNNGQTCMATRRVFVPRSLYLEFVVHLKPLVEFSEPARLVLPSAVDQANRMAAEAPEVLRSTKPVPLKHFPPTAMLYATPDMAICREAAFAPILAVIPYDDEAEMIRTANASPFGLSAAVYGRNRERARDVALQLKVGAVVVNDVIAPTAHPATPFGGRGASGWGVSQGAEGLLGMTVPLAVSVRGGRFRPHIDSTLTRDPAAGDVMEGMLRSTHSRRLGDRWRGLKMLVRGLRKFGKK